ncbi:hypothetical protein G7Y31_03990 [Corynebacterium lizhenjunii]|uniref:Transglycosylase SLT domain-containing protein n=1 Tax=Corynebacterium lizhenjunii TaxID=2709394 RepID=A0A7T0KFK7_9CORY|nr:hypothetical protein [Corynebacterium lizhenjunii]QPK79865.1 hypothetical protein G7Y31_03990 [Corynebacterium lizhenjunii]
MGRFFVRLGCDTVVAVVLIVALVAWALSFFHVPPPTRQLQPVSEQVPPAAGAAVVDQEALGELAGSMDVDVKALRAYIAAEDHARQAWPGCGLRWNTLAGIGWVETRHGTYGGNWFKPSHLDDFGVATPPIVGIALDGTNGTARIADTDGGVLDGDAEFDRAMGPMQFIPTSWERYGAGNPQNIADAAVAAANLLCSGGRDMSTEEGWLEAIYSYNHSRDYVSRVARAANSYALEQPAVS